MTVSFKRGELKIISGGQTGADQAALDWAIDHGVAHGGWCPKGRKTEAGPLSACYQLRESTSGAYLQRTEWNVRDSDATLIFTMAQALSGGSKRTAEFAQRHKKPWFHVWPERAPDQLIAFLATHPIRILNVAGSRQSTAPGIAAIVRKSLDAAISLEGSDD
jgi:hypothetical protein